MNAFVAAAAAYTVPFDLLGTTERRAGFETKHYVCSRCIHKHGMKQTRKYNVSQSLPQMAAAAAVVAAAAADVGSLNTKRLTVL